MAQTKSALDQALEDWILSWASLLTAPESVLWWPGLAVGLVGVVWFGRDRALWGRAADYWRELPVDAGCFIANSALPFLLSPLLFALSLIASQGAAAFVGALLGVGAIGAPEWPLLLLAALAAFVAGDFALYWTHRLFHAVPWLWQSHKLHHAPPVLTPLTAFRFWPWEQVVHLSGNMIGQGLGLGLVAGLAGAEVPALTVLGVNIFMLAWGLAFAHLRHSPVPMPFPRALSGWLISPHMHQLHHSSADQHRDRNFGTALALWDRMFGTYALPEKGERFRFGVDEAHDRDVGIILAVLDRLLGMDAPSEKGEQFRVDEAGWYISDEALQHVTDMWSRLWRSVGPAALCFFAFCVISYLLSVAVGSYRSIEQLHYVLVVLFALAGAGLARPPFGVAGNMIVRLTLLALGLAANFVAGAFIYLVRYGP